MQLKILNFRSLIRLIKKILTILRNRIFKKPKKKKKVRKMNQKMKIKRKHKNKMKIYKRYHQNQKQNKLTKTAKNIDMPLNKSTKNMQKCLKYSKKDQ